MSGKYRSEQPSQSGKTPILGQGHGLSNEEGDMIKQMIRAEQRSSRELFIPQQDLATEATTSMSPPTAQIIGASHIQQILEMFNRDFLYGQGRFDAYKDGLIFKWGDGYSRRHIWASVEDNKLVLETSHTRKCDKPYCNGTHHILTPDLYTNPTLINQELGDLFRRPVYESPED
jgi:hypothetical protein